MQDPVSPLPNSPLESAFEDIARSVAVSIVDALAEPLRREIEARIQTIIADATRDVHVKIATALGQIQPINIPINLFTQPMVQAPVVSPVAPAPSQIAAPPEVTATPTPAPAPAISAPTAAPTVPPPAPAAPLAMPAEPPAPPFRVNPVAATTTPRKSKNFAATVVGLKTGQAHLIKNEFKFLNLSFVTSTRNNNQLNALSKNKNVVLFMTDFISHSAVEAVRSTNGHWIYVSGGMTSLREKLQELYQKHQKENGLMPVIL